LESQEAKFQPADDFQRGCNVVVGGKLCVDKSVFRRSIGRSLRLAPGEETVRHIREHLAVAWVTFTPDLASEIPRMELELILHHLCVQLGRPELASTNDGHLHVERSAVGPYGPRATEVSEKIRLNGGSLDGSDEY